MGSFSAPIYTTDYTQIVRITKEKKMQWWIGDP
jgi:hypothetical protein